MESAAAWMEPSLDVDKLRYEIFSILENKFLFGCDDPKLFLSAGSPPTTPPKASAAGRVRILSIDGGGAASDSILAGFALARLEAFLRKFSGDPAARIADFFDLAAGSGAGGVLAAMLFTRGPDGRPLFSADEAHRLLTKNRSRLATSGEKGLLRKIFRRSGGQAGVFFRGIFGDATLRDTVKPVLIPCYDLASGAPFVFSRADAVETDGYDFLMREVCAATCAAAGAAAVEMRSVDGRTRIRAVGGGLVMSNPTAAAVTHVLNNNLEFPFAAGVENLLVLSLGAGEPEPAGRTSAPPSAADLVRIAGIGQADVVDQAVAMAFGTNRTTSYIRIQGNGVSLARAVDGVEAAEEALAERNVESVLFRGRKVTERTNGEKLKWATEELIGEHDWRRSRVPTVLMKPTMTPRTSCSTTVTTVSSRTSSGSP
ncbi:patatin-like protein 3 [Phoenix dactylifera]|uniref:Patatin n=1 Tax=Phoenix dactylifera TaxID=42345 RepID=A0A8B9A4H1_PHODC|nr:patatin-like protein 3 [Phoenix dactylifera]